MVTKNTFELLICSAWYFILNVIVCLISYPSYFHKRQSIHLSHRRTFYIKTPRYIWGSKIYNLQENHSTSELFFSSKLFSLFIFTWKVSSVHLFLLKFTLTHNYKCFIDNGYLKVQNYCIYYVKPIYIALHFWSQLFYLGTQVRDFGSMSDFCPFKSHNQSSNHFYLTLYLHNKSKTLT